MSAANIGRLLNQFLANGGRIEMSPGGGQRDLFRLSADSALGWNPGTSVMSLSGPTRVSGFNALSPRYELKWVAGQRGKPGINADILNAAEAVRMIADPDFEILGLNASSDDVTFNPEGGIRFDTDGTGTDAIILLPHLDAGQTAWTAVTWGTDQETSWECHIKTGPAIVGSTLWAGLKLTNTPVTATDADQAFFRFQDTVNGGKWQAVSSIANVDDEHDTGVLVAVSTQYHLKIVIDAARVARFYINGALVKTSAALTTAKDLIPYIGILEGAVAAKALIVYGQAISRLAA